MQIKQIPCDPRNFRNPRRSFIKYLVIHYDGNKGATAEGNGNYFAKTDTKDTSSHYFVDEKINVQSVGDNACAFHCGAPKYKHPLCRNDNSIGIEMCSDIDEFGNYIITEATVANTVELVRHLMWLYGIKEDCVLRHFDVTGKNCPAPWVKDESLWVDFKKRLEVKPVDWKSKIIMEAKSVGLISVDHNPDETATKWFVLQIALNAIKILKGGK